jgi:1,6-anhydro-N-acetylmuramate kinase
VAPDFGSVALLAFDIDEPVAMALIAVCTLAGLPSSLPAVTRASSASRLGHIHWP